MLRAVEGVESWAPEAAAPVEAGSVEPTSFDFEPAPLSGTALIGDDVADDPFLAEDTDTANDGEPTEPEASADGAEDPIDLTFDESEAAEDAVAEPAADGPATDDAAMEEPFDGLELELPETDVSLDDLEAQGDPGMVDLDEGEPELPGGAWGDLDDDLE